jgi:hypothetical protein
MRWLRRLVDAAELHARNRELRAQLAAAREALALAMASEVDGWAAYHRAHDRAVAAEDQRQRLALQVSVAQERQERP